MVIGHFYFAFTFQFEQIFIILHEHIIHISDCFCNHIQRSVIIAYAFYSEVVEMSESFDDILSDIPVFGHSVEPGPAAVWILHLGELVDCLIEFTRHPVYFEQNTDSSFSFAFILRFIYPRSFFEHYRFQLFVFIEIGEQCIRLIFSPGIEYLFYFRIRICNMGSYAVCIKSCKCLLGAFPRILHDVWQSLHGIPCRIGSEFESELIIR